jgi:hypothetical protein
MKSEELFDEDILYEMSNFNSRTTGLPLGIEIWTRSDPMYHGHNRYRIKVSKNKIWAAIFSVGADPKILKDISSTLSHSEKSAILSWVSEHYPLLIGHIDGKIDSGELSIELQKIKGSK